MLFPGENPIDSNPLAQLVLVLVAIGFIWFWAKCPPELQRFIGLMILLGCIGCAAFVLMANAPH